MLLQILSDELKIGPRELDQYWKSLTYLVSESLLLKVEGGSSDWP